jgi:hypothetical protein
MMKLNVVQLTPRVDEEQLLAEVIREAIEQYGAQAFCMALIEADQRTLPMAA